MTMQAPNDDLTCEQCEQLRSQNARLTTENWQLKGALGYEVPGNVPVGQFKCGLCEARAAEIEQLCTNNARLRAALLKIADGDPHYDSTIGCMEIARAALEQSERT